MPTICKRLIGDIDLYFGSKDTGYRTGATRLEIAAIYGLDVVILHLLRRNDLRAQSDDGNAQTALRLAVWLNHKNIVDVLIDDCSLPPNQRSPDLRFCPLWAARERGNVVLERRLLQHGWLPETSEISSYLEPGFKLPKPNIWPSREADTQRPKCTLDDIFSVTSPPFNLDFIDWLKGYLLLAVEKSCPEMIESLFFYKSKIDTRLRSSTSSGISLKVEAANTSLESCKSQIGIKSNSQIDIHNNLGQRKVIQDLLGQAGKPKSASFNWLTSIFAIPSPFGRSELHIAAQWGLGYVCLRLVMVEGLSNSKDNKGRTPLWEAAINGDEYVAGILVGGGSCPTLEDSDGNTPLSTVLSMQADGINLNYRFNPDVVERMCKTVREGAKFAFLTPATRSQRFLKPFREPPPLDRKRTITRGKVAT